jgi:hypothetical protein
VTITDALNTAGDRVFSYDRWVTLLGPTSGAAPAVTDIFDNCHAMIVVQSAGGSRLDFCELRWVLSDFLVDRTQPASFQRMVSVVMPDAAKTRLSLGDYVQEIEAVRNGGDTLTASAQLRAYHFGYPVRGYIVKNKLNGAESRIENDVVFNPMVDDKTLFNMSSIVTSVDGLNSFLWIHPESCQTESSEAFNESTADEWILQYAVESLCDLLNPDQTYIRNPTTQDRTLLSDSPPLRDVTIPLGARLPEALDRLLIPFGYNWYVKYDTGTEKPIIKLFKIGSGDEKQLYLQRPDSILDLNFSNCNQYEVSRSVGDSFNQVRVLGDLEKYEMTLPLLPGWPSNQDSQSASDLDKTDTGSDYVENELAWRQWVANEAGDLDETRSFGSLEFTVPQLQDVFMTYLPHRRNIEDPLTYVGGDEKQRRPILMEYSTDAGTTWTPVPEKWPIKLLPDQIGVLFDGDQPPDELVTASTSARLRITGTVTGDGRIEGLAEKEDFAANGRVFEQVLLADDKFFLRKRLTVGDYASTIAQYNNSGDEVDDTDKIKDYAEKIRDRNHHAEVDAEFRLPGLHLYYEIGDLITKIDGRDINLDAASVDAPVFRYPQIVERRFEFKDDGPYTVLVVDRGTEPDPFITDPDLLKKTTTKRV